jgi:hypothetical protein
VLKIVWKQSVGGFRHMPEAAADGSAGNRKPAEAASRSGRTAGSLGGLGRRGGFFVGLKV